MPIDTEVKLYTHLATSLEGCYKALESKRQPTYVGIKDGVKWCNGTWDTFLCWPSIPGNTSHKLPCPPLRGLDSEKFVIKHCHESGHWSGRQDNDFSIPHGYTDYFPCMTIDFSVFERAEQIAQDARKLEYVGLSLSFVSLLAAIVILSSFRRLQVFRNQIHKQLMLAILLNVTLRLILYIDLAIGRKEITVWQAYTINSMKIVCESMYLLLEYLKTVAYAFSFIEGFHLHNTVVVSVFQSSEPKLSRYLVFGWGFPGIHTAIWICVFVLIRGVKSIEKCLGDYYLQPDYWIMDGVRLFALVVNFIFLLRIVGVLWLKVKETHSSTEMEQLKKSVKGAIMLIPLLGIPNVMQVIPFQPRQHNLIYFAVFTYCASFFFMFQGFMVAVLYCFTNKEVRKAEQCKEIMCFYSKGHVDFSLS